MAVNTVDYRKHLPHEYISQENGQRRYGGPPPHFVGSRPSRGNEVFVGKLPRRIDEQALWALVNVPAAAYEMRVMIDFSGDNRGFAFVIYMCKEDAKRAVSYLNNREVMPNRRIGCVPSVDNRRLFVGGLPRERGIAEVKQELTQLVEGVTDVILYPSATDKSKNRGFAFVEFVDHRMAALARQRMTREKTHAFGQLLCVDWAEPEQQVDEETMSHVRILYVRNLLLSTEERAVREAFETVAAGQIEKAKKIKDFAFVHFRTRDAAQIALQRMNGALLDGAVLEVMWAKPPDRTIMKQVRSSLKTTTQPPPPPPQLLNGATTVNPFDATTGGGVLFTPTEWAYAGSPLIDATHRTAIETASAVLPQHDRVLSRLARGAAGTRGVGFQSYVNNQMRRTRRRYVEQAGVLQDMYLLQQQHTYPYMMNAAPLLAPLDLQQQYAFVQQQQQVQLVLAQQQQYLLQQQQQQQNALDGTPLLTPMSLSTSPTSACGGVCPVDVLEQVCALRAWAAPIYELQTLTAPANEGDTDEQPVVFLYKLTISALSLSLSNDSPSATEQEAKRSIAQTALNRLTAVLDAMPFVFGAHGIMGQ